MKRSKWVVSVLVLVLMLSMVSFKPMQSPVCSQVPIGYQGVEAMVLAAYQVWYGMPSHRCAFLPFEWPYDSRDRNVIRRHIREAKERGISGFVVDWYGPEAGVASDEDRGFMDQATTELFTQAEELQDFYVALMYDDQTVKYAESDPTKYESRVKKDLQYAKEQYFGSPAYLEINGCPALFIFPDDEVKPYLSWKDIKAHLGVPVTLLDRDPNPAEPDYDSNFEGFFAWVTATNGQWDPNGQEWGEEYLEWFYNVMQGVYADKVGVGGVWPGFDDSLAPWSENRFVSRYQPEGMTHDLTLKLAEDNNVEYILVGTWNDFEEGTDIEYGVRMLVDMEIKLDNGGPYPEVLIRSSPVKVVWSPVIPSADLEIWTTHDLINYEFIDKQPFSCGDYLSLTPGNLYELKIWTQIPPYSKWVKIRRIDPVPGVDPVVFETKTITVTSPNSGKNWQVNSSQTITWTSTGEVGDVKIQFSDDNGCNWSSITPSTANDGFFPWTVPDTVSNKCLIRVSETDGVPAGTSGMFSIIFIPSPPPEIALNRTQLYFGATTTSIVTGSQSVLIENNGGGTLKWEASSIASWLIITPPEGTGTGVISVSVTPSELAVGNHTGTITITDPNASNSPQEVAVNLTVKSPLQDQPPFGDFSTPLDNSTVSSSIPVTGWVLDDIEVESVKIYRKEKDLIYIGDAVFVEGARPDVKNAYPDYPMNYRAGWGYMMLTNFLPNGGNGPFKIHAVATDADGHQVTLGTKSITCDNANAIKPFGSIDTPTPGGTATGSNYINWGWVLTPKPNCIPTDGSTINVYVDGVNLGHPTYNIYRSDIALLFPGYCNSNGAAGYFSLDTTAFENGVHTIQWTARDNAGNTDGIGSRYFTIQNTGSSSGQLAHPQNFKFNSQQISSIPIDYNSPLRFRRSYDKTDNMKAISQTDKGISLLKIKELERIELLLVENENFVNGFLFSGNLLLPLPIGSTLRNASFCWIPGPGFLGDYRFLFVVKGKDGAFSKREVVIRIEPRFGVKK
ncbi:MAG: hypothetical protein JSV88_22265 [Candidatus Aminicenantes bacterium]|nr:MAG: hypothetical protein JSV88_22265 [Candidatus Aminicenantes bacterium]